MAHLEQDRRSFWLTLAFTLLLLFTGCRSENPMATDRVSVAAPSEGSAGRSRVSRSIVLRHEYDGNLNDASGFGNAGIAHGDPTFAPWCRDQSLVLDGVDDYVSVAPSPSIEPSVVSVEVLLRPAQDLTGGSIFVPIVVKLPDSMDYGTRVDGYDIIYQDPPTTPARLGFAIGTEGGTLRVHASAFMDLEAGAPYHVVGTYDQRMLRLFLNGEEVAATPCTQPIAYLGGPLHVGGNIRHSILYPSREARYFRGAIDEVTIYDRALSAHEIRRIARARLADCARERR